MQCASQLLPAARANWARAMRSEFDHIKDGRRAFLWALGCVFTGIKERMASMIKGNLKISRWLLAPEMLLCFTPLTLLWLDAIDGSSGWTPLNAAAIHKHFLSVPGGTAFLITLIAGAALATIGPVGLFAGFRMVVTGRPLKNAWLRVALIAAPILFGAMTLLLRLSETGAAAFDFAAVDAFDFWSGIVLLSALPALGAAHLLRLSPLPGAAKAAPTLGATLS
jgi:hypothetical protein